MGGVRLGSSVYAKAEHRVSRSAVLSPSMNITVWDPAKKCISVNHWFGDARHFGIWVIPLNKIALLHYYNRSRQTHHEFTLLNGAVLHVSCKELSDSDALFQTYYTGNVDADYVSQHMYLELNLAETRSMVSSFSTREGIICFKCQNPASEIPTFKHLTAVSADDDAVAVMLLRNVMNDFNNRLRSLGCSISFKSLRIQAIVEDSNVFGGPPCLRRDFYKSVTSSSSSLPRTASQSDLQSFSDAFHQGNGSRCRSARGQGPADFAQQCMEACKEFLKPAGLNAIVNPARSFWVRDRKPVDECVEPSAPAISSLPSGVEKKRCNLEFVGPALGRESEFATDRVNLSAPIGELSVSNVRVFKKKGISLTSSPELSKREDPRLVGVACPDEDEQRRIVAQDLHMSDDSDDDWTHDCSLVHDPGMDVAEGPTPSAAVNSAAVTPTSPLAPSQLDALTGDLHSPVKSKKYEKHASPATPPMSRCKLNFYSDSQSTPYDDDVE